jgi:hypothetical protein
MTALATEHDVEERLGRSLTTSESERLGALLDDVTAAMQNYTGRTFASQTHVLRTRVRSRYSGIRLPQRPVTAVTTVKAINYDGTLGATLAGWRFDGIDTLYVAGPGTVINATTWARPAAVEIAYTAGYAESPADLVGIVCAVALRALGRAPLEGGLTSETIDGYSYSVGSTGAAGPFGFLPDERAVLDTYRLSAGSIQLTR